MDRAKAIMQIVNLHTTSPEPSIVSSISVATGTSTFASSIAPDDSVSQVSMSRPYQSPFALSLHGTFPREVSPAAPPLLSVPSSNAVSRDVSPSAESVITTEEDCVAAPGVDYKTLLEGIPKPWNVGTTAPPPPLPEPFHIAKLKPEVLQLMNLLKDRAKLKQASKEDRDKAKAATRPRVSNFREQDQTHVKLTLEYMDDLVVTVYAFPDSDTSWTFSGLANYYASKKLGRSYRIERESEHCRLVRPHHYPSIYSFAY